MDKRICNYRKIIVLNRMIMVSGKILRYNL